MIKYFYLYLPWVRLDIALYILILSNKSNIFYMYCSFCVPKEIQFGDSQQSYFNVSRNLCYSHSHPCLPPNRQPLPQNMLASRPKISLKRKKYCGYQLRSNQSHPIIHHAHIHQPQINPPKYPVVNQNQNMLATKSHPVIKIYDVPPKIHPNISRQAPFRHGIGFNRLPNHQFLNLIHGFKGHCKSVKFFQRNPQIPILETTKKQSMLVNSVCQNLTTVPSQANYDEEDCNEQLKKLSSGKFDSHSDEQVQHSNSRIKQQGSIKQANDRELSNTDSVNPKLVYSYEFKKNQIAQKQKNSKEQPLSKSHNCLIFKDIGSIDLIQCKKTVSINQSESNSQMSEVIFSSRDLLSKTNVSLIRELDERSSIDSKYSEKAQIGPRDSHL